MDNYFPDLQLFLDSVKVYMKNTEEFGQPVFSDQEIYRLKKIVLRVKTQIRTDE